MKYLKQKGYKKIASWLVGSCVFFTGGAFAATDMHKHLGSEESTSMTAELSGKKAAEHSMQNMAAPKNSRSPDAYSDGLSLTQGPYLLKGVPRLMLADEYNFWSIAFNRLEWVETDSGDVGVYDGQAWFGKTYNRGVIKAEGEVANGKLVESKTELLYSHAIAPFWDVQGGVRHDSTEGPDRNWLVVGLQGLAPYWFDVDAALYFGEQGRSMLQVEVDYELLLTQRLILQPRFEATFYGQNDKEIGVGSGLSATTTGLRLRYEFTRKFAPYVGVEWSNKFGNTAKFNRVTGGNTQDTKILAGVRLWF